jgi:glutamate dehydrogenase (NAD(P)+)
VQDLQQFFWDEAEVNDRLYRVLQRAFASVLDRATRDNVAYRTAAMAIGVAKVRDAKASRGLFP